MVAGPPQADVPTPAAVERLAAGSPLRVVWENELGGLTFEIEATPVRRFVKWAPAGSGLDLSHEATRLEWAAPYAAVPRVLDHGADASGSWLLTAGLPGESAVAARWLSDPPRAVAAIGAGLRALHDALPVDGCPYSWSVADRLARVGDPAARERLADAPPLDRLVVCHGDACAPNTLVGDDGRWSGHVDLGALGLADRWADIAVATWSTEWNYGPGWEQPLLAAYGIAPDPERTTYYRQLWDASP